MASSPQSGSANIASATRDGIFAGHPRGLMTLFLTEMWERFSYYGMRAILVLFMTAPLAGMNPGLGLDVKNASAIYGLYTSGVYLLSLPGGWVADKLWGQRKAVFVGGCIIACGHFSMAIPTTYTFFQGLALIVLGTGLLKPNVSAMVGDLYPDGGARRDAGFSIFYMGINLGGFLGPSLCGFVGEGYRYHLGFALAGIGMVFGLVQYALGGKHLREAGLLKTDDSAAALARRSRYFYLTAVVAAFVFAGGFYTILASFDVTMSQMAAGIGYGIVILIGAFFLYLFFGAGLDATEKRNLGVIVWLFLLSAIFWAGYEQAGSSLNIFARDLTNRAVAGWQVPASWLQDVNPVFIILFAPLFGGLWTWLAARKANPSTPAKFALGLTGLSAGFFVLAWGAVNASGTHRVAMAWLIVTYFFHTVGELCLSPVGLSAMTKLAPQNRVGQILGVWFVSIALGDLFAGLEAGRMQELAPGALFRGVAWATAAAALLAFSAAPFLKRLGAGVE